MNMITANYYNLYEDLRCLTLNIKDKCSYYVIIMSYKYIHSNN